MADEPNKNMDAMLRAYAKKRAAPELPVHPATRRMLQGEVRRVHGVPAPPRAGWRAHWPQFAFGATLSLVVGLTVAILRFPPKEKQLAKNEARAVEGDVANVTISAANQPAKDLNEQEALPRERQLALTPPVEEARKEKLLQDASADKRAGAESSLALAERSTRSIPVRKPDAAPSGIAPELLKRSSAPKVEAAIAPRETVITATGKASERNDAEARPAVLARANELTNLGAAMRMRFVQTNLPAAAVLRSFQVEQVGEQLRFVDFDGSIYSGTLQQNQNAGPAAAGLLQVGDRDLAANAAVFFFQANGTNRTLGRSVAIEGQYFDKTNLPALESVNLRIEAKERTQALSAEPQQARRTIVGRTTIGGTNEVPLRAVSVER